MPTPRIPLDHPIRAEIKPFTPFSAEPTFSMMHAIVNAIDERQQYSPADFLKPCGLTDYKSTSFFAALTFLSTTVSAIFDAQIYLIVDDVEYDLTGKDREKVIGGLPIAHPVTGVEIANPMEKTYLRYTLVPGL